MDDKQIFEYAANPEKIISPEVCNLVIATISGHISDLTEEEWEKRLVASQHKVTLMNYPGNTNAKAKAEWEISDEYIKWQSTVRKLRQYKAYRSDLRDRFTVLTNTKRY